MVKVKKSSIAKVFSVKNVIIAFAALSLLVVTTFIVSGTETQEFVFGSFAKSKNAEKAKKPSDLDCGSKKVAVCNKQGNCSCTSPAKAVEYYGPETKLGERCPADSPKGKDYRYRPGKMEEDCGVSVASVPTTTTPVAPTGSANDGDECDLGTPDRCGRDGFMYRCAKKANGATALSKTTTRCPAITTIATTPTTCRSGEEWNNALKCCAYTTTTSTHEEGECTGHTPTPTIILKTPQCSGATTSKVILYSHTCYDKTNKELNECNSGYMLKDGVCVASTLKTPQCSYPTVGNNVKNATQCYDKQNASRFECKPPFTASGVLCRREPQCPKSGTVKKGTPNSIPCYDATDTEHATCSSGYIESNGQCTSMTVIQTTTPTATNTPSQTATSTPTYAPTNTATPNPAPEPNALEILSPEKGESGLVIMPLTGAFVGSTISSIIDYSDYIVVGQGAVTGKAGIASLNLPTQAEIDEKKESYNRCMWYGILFFRKDACLAENLIPVVVYYPPEVAEQKTCTEYQAAQATVTVASQANDKLSSINDFDFIDVKCAIY